MKSIGTKQLVPIITALIGVIFLAVGITQLGFWDGVNGPRPGFFPSIMAVVIVLSSLLALKQSFAEGERAEYKRDEGMFILAAIGIFAAVFVIGLIPACLVFVILWLKIFEKADWKDTIIVTLVVAAIAVGVFGIWLGIQFPIGIFGYIL